MSTRPDPTMALWLLVLCRMSPSNRMMFRRLIEPSDSESELLAAAGLRAGADAAAGEAAGCSRDCSKCCLELVCLADFAAGVAREVAMHLTRISICALLRAHTCILASMHVPRMLPAGVKYCLPRFTAVTAPLQWKVWNQAVAFAHGCVDRAHDRLRVCGIAFLCTLTDVHVNRVLQAWLLAMQLFAFSP